jgi:hypothetical protein
MTLKDSIEHVFEMGDDSKRHQRWTGAAWLELCRSQRRRTRVAHDDVARRKCGGSWPTFLWHTTSGLTQSHL